MWVYTDTITSDSCSRFVGWTSMMSISRSTTSQRCFTALEWSPQSPDLNPVNLSCSRNQFWVLLHGTLSCCKHPYADGSIHADRPSPTPPSLPVCTTNMRQDGSMLSWCFCHILTLPAECHCRNQDKTLAQLTKHKHCTLHSIHSVVYAVRNAWTVTQTYSTYA